MERIDGIGRIVQSFVPTYKCISSIADSKPSDVDNAFQNVPWDNKTRVMAQGLKAQMKKFEFILTLVAMKELLSYLSALTVGLQGIKTIF